MSNAASKAKCEFCGKGNARQVERTNPLNYHVQILKLCAPCRTKLGLSVKEPAGRGQGYRLTTFGDRTHTDR